MNINAGLVSISFREKCVNEIIRLCCEANLKYIEWGGDVHCPAGDTARARELRILTKNAGLIPYCYGSYFRVGVNPVSDFEKVCESAAALGAETVRVWAYSKSFGNCTEAELLKIQEDAGAVFEMAKKYGLCVNFEYHRNSLTEGIDGALKLFSGLDRDVLRVHWQPNPEITVNENLRELELLPRIDLVHVFAWTHESDGSDARHPLFNHHETWQEYIALAKKKNPACVFELEFFKDNSEVQFCADAETLLGLLKV